MKQYIREIISDFFARDLSGIRHRSLILPEEPQRIITVIGARRVGKTFLLLHHIQKLRAKADPERFLYINFENDRFFPFSLEQAQQIVDTYYELYPEKKEVKVYFFFDEIQNIPQWNLFVRRLYDTENCCIFLTGSSSQLLSSEIATSLRGRTLTFELFPLSFREFLHWQGIEGNVALTSSKRAEIVHAYDQYISRSALPELIGEKDLPMHSAILHEYLNMVIYKDLVERHSLTQHTLIRHFIKFLSLNISNFISIHKLFNDFKSQGFRVSKNTLYDFVTYLEESFIFYTTKLFSTSVREQQRNPQKIYAVDIGLKLLMDYQPDQGRILENIVYLELRRKTNEIFYLKGIQEIDFFINTPGNRQIINVARNIKDTKTFNREINSMAEAMNKFQISKGTLVTGEGTAGWETRDNVRIEIIPAWQWLFQQ